MGFGHICGAPPIGGIAVAVILSCILWLDLTTLQRRRIRGDLIETYKILSVKERISSVQFFKLSTNEHGLRAHNLKIFKQRSRLDVGRFFFSNRVVNDWNSLPQQVVDSTSTNAF